MYVLARFMEQPSADANGNGAELAAENEEDALGPSSLYGPHWYEADEDDPWLDSFTRFPPQNIEPERPDIVENGVVPIELRDASGAPVEFQVDNDVRMQLRLAQARLQQSRPNRRVVNSLVQYRASTSIASAQHRLHARASRRPNNGQVARSSKRAMRATIPDSARWPLPLLTCEAPDGGFSLALPDVTLLLQPCVLRSVGEGSDASCSSGGDTPDSADKPLAASLFTSRLRHISERSEAKHPREGAAVDRDANDRQDGDGGAEPKSDDAILTLPSYSSTYLVTISSLFDYLTSDEAIDDYERWFNAGGAVIGGADERSDAAVPVAAGTTANADGPG